jgi:hypothetical protein
MKAKYRLEKVIENEKTANAIDVWEDKPEGKLIAVILCDGSVAVYNIVSTDSLKIIINIADNFQLFFDNLKN